MKKSIVARFGALMVIFATFAVCTSEDPSPSPADPRESFVGNWMVNETGMKRTFECTITLDQSSTTRVLISNFAGSGPTSNPAVAEVSGNTINLIPDQVIGDGWIINGGGVLSGSNKINWSYTLNNGADLFSLTAVFTRI